MNERFEKIIEFIKNIVPEASEYIFREQLSINVPKEKLVDVAEKLKTDAGMSFDMCIDVTAIDWLDKKDKRFEVVYFLYSNKFKSRVRIKTEIDENDCTCPTLTNVWASANWYERETYDMYGIKFIGHPDLRRFYMPEDYVNPETGEPIHPLRKDFPLMGIPDSLPLPPYPEKYGEK